MLKIHVTNNCRKCTKIFYIFVHFIRLYRGSYMSALVLFNLLNKLRKRDKMGGLPSILSLFLQEFNKFINTGAPMLDSFYHMTLRLPWLKKVIILSLCTQHCYELNICKPFYCMALFHSQTQFTPYDKYH